MHSSAPGHGRVGRVQGLLRVAFYRTLWTPEARTVCTVATGERRGPRRSPEGPRRPRKVLETTAGMGMSQWPYGRGPPAHLGGETDMHHGRRSTRSGPELQLPSRKQWHLGQGRDAHAGPGGPTGTGAGTAQAKLPRRQLGGNALPSPGTRACTWGWSAWGWDVQLGGNWAAVVGGVVSRQAAVTVWAW